MVAEVSVLIPVYNYDITFLVQQLLDQCRQAAISFEIICLDDASNEFFKKANQKLQFLKNVIYEELPQTISRAAIRNQLADRAKFSYLLFLDNDSCLVSDQFITNYLQTADPFTVFIGGTVYQTQPPEIKYRLHWHYGSQREQRAAALRQRQPYNQLQVNNLFINRSLYLSQRLPEILQTYGHEDTLWGKQLEKAQVPVQHLNNPVLHAGLEPAPIFLLKTGQAVQNMVALINSNESSFSFSSLYQTYKLLRKYRFLRVFNWIFKKSKPLLLLQLQIAKPSLFLFDLYKLGLFGQAMRKSK